MLTTIRILGLFLSINGSTGCTVDRVEGTVSVLTCDTSTVDVDASYVGVEGTTYGTVETVVVHYDGSAGKIVL
jgi:hypothetical protein